MVLFLTDSLTKKNGMSVFSGYFRSYLIQKYPTTVLVYEFDTRNFTKTLRSATPLNKIDKVFVNGHYSIADVFVRKKKLARILEVLDVELSPNCEFILISHGWFKIKPRFNLYTLLYNFKYFYRHLTIDKITSFYSSILFISSKRDVYRHYDYDWCLRTGFEFSFFEYSSGDFFTKSLCAKNNINSYVLVISNFDLVKNLLLLAFINLTSFFIRKKKRNFVLLTSYPESISGQLIKKTLLFSGVKIIYDQSQKDDLLNNCQYLFIPSYSEYLPLTAFEAFSYKKYVVSFYFINGLSGFHMYKYLKR